MRRRERFIRDSLPAARRGFLAVGFSARQRAVAWEMSCYFLFATVNISSRKHVTGLHPVAEFPALVTREP